MARIIFSRFSIRKTASRLLLPLLLFCTSNAAIAAMTKPTVTVDGPVVTLGDVLLDARAAQDHVIAAAPQPGKSMTLSRFDIDRAMANAGLAEGLDDSRGYVTISRRGKKVPPEILEARIMDKIAQNGGPDRLKIRLTGLRSPLYIAPQADLGDIEIENLSHDERSGRFTATIAIAQENGVWNRTTLSGLAEPVRLVPVLVRALSDDDIISRSDIDWIELPERRINRTMILESADLIGLSPTRTVRAGTPLRMSEVQKPVLVEKGAFVTMQVRHGGLMLSATGKAMQDGALGDFIRLINTSTNRTIEAQVAGLGVVNVLSHVTLSANQ
ncbi:flagellar basal body P-ring biosynthesis protein FlgA [Iodidimonas muriae]|uniref:Flagellar basal body P-ring biosynthesis protein FlgA n=2 Tax=Iodidimonas muriae TaxID=261467 RepID=A0ABQ2L7M6_9PROT|nr:flagellar basal body P-ring biosynthesis protein FlgA [Kordiimonadales bacterium JCM 17843]GGO06162.1 flagellar basal body P-ring biosynthesis protein FlgA [Iodidimonas muriae]